MFKLPIACFVLPSLALCACSRDDQSGSLPGTSVDCSFQSCGGDLTGDWQISGGCVDDPSVRTLEGCPDSTITFDASLSGALSFAADGTYTLSTTLGGTRSYSVPSACSAGASCDAVGQSITASCAATASSCECSAVVEPTSSRRTGRYDTNDGELEWTRDDGEPEAALSAYCVSGNSLKLRLTDADGKVTLIVATR